MRDFFLALMLIAGIAGMPARAASGDDASASTVAESPSAASAKTTALSFVLLREPRLPDAATVRRQLETRLAGRLKVESVPTRVGDDDRLVMLFRVAGGTAMVGLLDRPLPAGERVPAPTARSRRSGCGWTSACPARRTRACPCRPTA